MQRNYLNNLNEKLFDLLRTWKQITDLLNLVKRAVRIKQSRNMQDK